MSIGSVEPLERRFRAPEELRAFLEEAIEKDDVILIFSVRRYADQTLMQKASFRFRGGVGTPWLEFLGAVQRWLTRQFLEP